MDSTIYILPSEQAAERKRREIFAQSREAVWLGEEVFSLPHFLQTLADPAKPVFKRSAQKHLMAYCLRSVPLKHFGKLKGLPGLAQIFLEAIRSLKRHCIFPGDLESLLEESGSLKEHDLCLVFKKYEEEKNRLGWLDEEDLYKGSSLRLTSPLSASPILGRGLVNLRLDPIKIIFENFLEQPKALEKLCSELNAEWRPIPKVQPEDLSHVRLFSLPGPFQEAHWFVQQMAVRFRQGSRPVDIGILTDGSSLVYESLWQKLKNFSLVQDPSPFLTWQERPEGRKILDRAAAIPKEKAPLKEWLEALRDEPLLEVLPFHDFILPFGELSKTEWLAWAAETLAEKPEIKTSQALEGLQWLDLSQGDFPSLKFLWVPALTEGHFPKITPSLFFQDPKDRARPEWRELCEAFPDPSTLLQKKQRAFLYPPSRTEAEVWLTFSRLDAMGDELAPSPFSWDFGPAKEIGHVAAAGAPLPEAKLQIEKERLADRLTSGAFHARLSAKDWKDKIAPMQKDHCFSPSQLETYAQCPFKYFSERVLQIPPQKEFSPELDPDDRGTLFHDSMEDFLKAYRDLFCQARENAGLEPDLFEKLEAVVRAVFEQSREKLDYAHPELYEYLLEKTLHQAKEVVAKELEEARKLKNPLEPFRLEWAFGKEGDPPVPMEGWQMGGRIDRIDVDPQSGRFLILDYKTGNVQSYKKKLMEGLSLQLPLYILAVRRHLLAGRESAGGLLIETKEGKKKAGLVDKSFNKIHFQLYAASKALMKTEEFEETLAQAAQWAQRYVNEIRAGNFSAVPKECESYCDYKEICRYAGKPFV